jgi:tRNA nucleotidyltransferase (CCA-adding enzyme)
MSSTNLLTALRGRLSAPDKAVLDAAVRLAEERAIALYLVGGSVRDLLLRREQLDLDIAVEGDAIDLAQALAAAAEGRVAVHPSFGTASVRGAFFSVDLARTRAEEYPHPGSLPVVRPASLDDDLARRDFTVNAMALRLTRPQAGRLVDPFGGRGDLERRAIRVLHDGSFRDDATRMLRAVRYEGRLSFRLEEGTARLIERDRRCLDTIGGARLRRELLALLYEESPPLLLARCQELGLLAALHPSLEIDGRGVEALLRASDERPAPWDEVCLCLLCWRSGEREVESLVERLALPRRHERALHDAVKLRALLPTLEALDLPVSAAVETLEPLSIAAVWALNLRTEQGALRERTMRFLREWRHVRPFLGGRALKRLGVPEGPDLGALLRRLRAARLDGLTRSREDEVALVEKSCR